MNVSTGQAFGGDSVFDMIRTISKELLGATSPGVFDPSMNGRSLTSLGLHQQELIDVQSLIERHFSRLGEGLSDLTPASSFEELLEMLRESEPDQAETKSDSSEESAVVVSGGSTSSKTSSSGTSSSGSASAGESSGSGETGDGGATGVEDPPQETGETGPGEKTGGSGETGSGETGSGDSGSGGDGSGDDAGGGAGGLLDLLL